MIKEYDTFENNKKIKLYLTKDENTSINPDWVQIYQGWIVYKSELGKAVIPRRRVAEIDIKTEEESK